MQLRGTITDWNDEKGFGFVTPDAGGERVFVHISSLLSRQARPRGGETVVCEVGPGRNGRPQALRVHYIAPTAPAVQRRSGGSGVASAAGPAWAAAAAFVLGLVALGLLGRAPLWAPLVYAGMSLVAFAAYEDDKRKAKAGAWRTPEATLHLMALLGGWPGALIAQQTLRHKTRKADFQGVFWAIVLLHGAFWAWYAAGAPGLLG